VSPGDVFPSVPKLWTGDREAPIAEPGVRPIGTIHDMIVSTSADPTVAGVGNQLTVVSHNPLDMAA